MNEVKVYATKIYSSDTLDKYAFIRSYLSNEKLCRIDKYRLLDDKHRSLKSEWLVRHIINKYTGLPYKDISISISKDGKPYICNASNLHYNISHSGKWVICAIGPVEVGIDIEMISSIDFAVINQCFSQNEIANFHKIPEKDRLAYFYDLWTLKESLVKSIGKGLLMPLNSFSIEQGTDSIVFKEPINATFYFKQFKIDPKYKLSVCSRLNRFNNSIEIITF